MIDIDRRIITKNNELNLLECDTRRVREELESLKREKEILPSFGGRDISLDDRVLYKLSNRMVNVRYVYKNDGRKIDHGELIYKIHFDSFHDPSAMIQTVETGWLHKNGLFVSSFANYYLYISKV